MEQERTEEELKKLYMQQIRAQFRDKMQKGVCSNSKVELTEEDSLEFTITNCGNMKRHCSRYCQYCSDKHNDRE